MEERIRQLRKYLGLSQSQFAKGINKTSGFISLIETGRCGMSADTVSSLSEVYGVSEEWLLTGQGEMFEPGRELPKAELQQIGQRIKLIRTRKGLTQDRFAEKIGCSQNQVYLVESGKSIPTENFLLAASAAFKIDYQWLKCGVGAMDEVLDKKTEELNRITQLMKEDSVAREVVLEAMKHDRAIWLKIDRFLREVQRDDNK